MTFSYRALMLTGAAAVLAAGVALAQVSPPSQIETPSPTDMAGQQVRPQGRFADRFMAEFDMNHDGKVTRDEFNKVVSVHFLQMTGGKPQMTVDQFTNAHIKEFRARVTEMFRRTDWNGDGRLSLEEFSTPIRVRFETMDRDGTGSARCFGSDTPPPAQKNPFSRRRSSSGSRGRGNLCGLYDADHQGRLTRAALDKAVQVEFTGASKGASMSFDQFYQLELARYRDVNARIFHRIDRDHNGTIAQAEYAASEQRFFARLDKNNDGVVTGDDLSFHRGSKAKPRKA